MKNDKLCAWLRDNSGGIYSPCAVAADRIEALEDVLFEIISLPLSNKELARDVAMAALKDNT